MKEKSYSCNLKYRVIVFLTMFFGYGCVMAQTLLTESFNYASGTVLTAANWTQVANSTNPITVSAGNLEFTGTVGSGMGNKVALTNSGQDVYRSFVATTSSIYASLVVNVSTANLNGDYFFYLGTTASPYITTGAKIYIRSNASGYSFGVLRGSGGTPAYETTVRPFNQNIHLVLKYEVIAGANNDIIKLYVNPVTTEEPAVAAVSYDAAMGEEGALSAVGLVQAIATDAPTLEVDNIHVSTSWAATVLAAYDYGDAPKSYDFTKDDVYVPAVHNGVAGFSLGALLPDFELLPLSVSTNASNNNDKGDGLDEDALDISTLAKVRKAAAYQIDIPVNNPTTTTKYLYGWIDFNNDGKFQVEEIADAVISFTNTGPSMKTLHWNPTKTSAISEDVSKLYMRLRLTDRVLNDFTTAASGGSLVDERSIGNGALSAANVIDYPYIVGGEVEDYQLDVVKTFDYGDVPQSFEKDKDGNYRPALHAPWTDFSIGNRIDVEGLASSVAPGTENNTQGDNASGQADEDGLVTWVSVSPGLLYSIAVPVNVPPSLAAGTKYLYGWLDLNGDGQFQLGEVATKSVSGSGLVTSTLSWSAAQTAQISAGRETIYLRLRLSNLVLNDFTTAGDGGATLDERSIGNGAASSLNASNHPIVSFGEVEDYQLPVGWYDYGDAPISYEQPGGTFVPARHAIDANLRIGLLLDDEASAQNVAAQTDNNGANGDGVDEDGIDPADYIIQGSEDFVLPVKVTNTTGNMMSLYGWIDINQNGVFDISEVATINVSGGTINGTVALRWPFAVTGLLDNGENVYLRLRFASTGLGDNSATTYDERAYGDGRSTGGYGTVPVIGEIEDYNLRVNSKGLRVFNTNGGLTPTDGLRIQMSGAGNLQIYRDSKQQIYSAPLVKNMGLYNHPGTTHGIALSIGNSYYTTATLQASGKTKGAPPIVLSNTGVNELGPDGGVQKNIIRMKVRHQGLDYFLTVTYTYTAPEWLMGVNYEVEIPEGNRETVKLAQGWDTYLSRDDRGPGFVRGKAPYYTMGVARTDAFEAFRYKSGVPWSGYYSGLYSNLSANLGTNAQFTNHINTDASTDNGIGISIDFGSQPGTYSSTNEVIFRCDAPISAPVLKAMTVDIACGMSTTDLSTLFTGTLPRNVVLRWFDKTTDQEINPQEAGVGVYEVEYYDTANNCSSPRATVTVIKTSPEITGISPSTQAVCQFGTTHDLTATVIGTGITYQWFSNTTNSNVGGVPIGGATHATYTPSSAVPGTWYYYVGVTSKTCTVYSDIFTVTVGAPTITGESEVGVGRKTQLTGSGTPQA